MALSYSSTLTLGPVDITSALPAGRPMLEFRFPPPELPRWQCGCDRIFDARTRVCGNCYHAAPARSGTVANWRTLFWAVAFRCLAPPWDRP